MKTIPVLPLVVTVLLAPVGMMAQTTAEPRPNPAGGEDGKPGRSRPMKERWQAADRDHDGLISQAEFDQLPRIQRLPEEKRQQLFSRLDKNGDGQLAGDELARLERQGPPMQRLWELDVDHSGGISLSEFKAGAFFKKLPPERQEEMFRRLDTNGDGNITPQDKPKPPFAGQEGGPHPHRRGDADAPHNEGRRLLRLLDADRNGSISLDEYRAAEALRDLPADVQQERFNKLDRNHDGVLTADDFPPPPPAREAPQKPAPTTPPAAVE